MTTTYTADIKNFLSYTLGGIILNLTLAAIIGGISGFVFFLFLNTLYSIYQLRSFRPKSISLDFENRVMTFIHSNILKSEQIETFSISDISFSYRKRTVSKRINDVRNVCIIDNKRKTIVMLTPDQDGWSDTQIKNISTDLVKIGIKRISEKYSDIEAPLNETVEQV